MPRSAAGWVAHTAGQLNVADPDNAPAAIAVDGEALRGTFGRTGGAGVHLLAAISRATGDDLSARIVPRQRPVEAKTSEIA